MSRRMLEILEQEFGLTLNRRYFLIGSVYPDYSYNFIFHKHKSYVSLSHIKCKIEKLCRYQGDTADFLFSFSLGIVVHYICDYFCMPHSRLYDGTLGEHMRYEKLLKHKYRLKKKLLSGGTRLIFPLLGYTSEILEYLDRMLTQQDNDLAYDGFVHLSDVPRAMEVATQVLCSICTRVAYPWVVPA